MMRFINIPFSIFAGMAVGLLAGRLFAVYFEKIHIRDTTKVLFRMAGVLVCLFHTGFEKKEKLFTMLAYTPKATVQAAGSGGIPLAMGFACGDCRISSCSSRNRTDSTAWSFGNRQHL